MDYFPLFIRTQDQPCLIIGGGEVALRKARMLMKANATITVIAAESHPELQRLAAERALTLLPAKVEEGISLKGFRLVIAATDDHELNARVAADAATAGVFCNVVDNAELSTAIVPALIDRSPMVVAVSSGGRSPVMATRLRQQIEQLLPAAFGRIAEFAGERRSQVKQRFSDIGQRRHFWQRFLDGTASDHLLKDDTAAAEQQFQAELASAGEADGFAWIVGAGPGDPDLLTLKAARVLASADTILHDRLVAPAILEMARRDAHFVSVGKQAGKPSMSQTAINALLVEHVRRGERVCRLKGGDPFIFGRGGEEIEALEAADLPWAVVPGITAASGCAAATGTPLTHRQLSRGVTLITASTADDAHTDWARFAAHDHTLVIYMAVRKLDTVCAGLRGAGLPGTHPALLIENGTTERQRMLRGTLDDIAEQAAHAHIGSPAILMVGEVADLNATAAAGVPHAPAEDVWSPAAQNG